MIQPLPLVTETVRTKSRSELVDVTGLVQASLTRQQVFSGFAIVFVPHTTAGITIQENADPDVKSDLIQKLDQLIPKKEAFYDHAEGNSDSHLKTALVGNSVTVLIEGGRMVLGQWQGIYFCEFDGPREREMHIKIIDLQAKMSS